ncbi:Cleavage and polyadenylation specificity factor subunit 6 [Acipenser ruthenus]|uniref:Cleavage and polyadenylation specificity factor subunit 6 n=1 Tax=Acipenser ruthenus TaxID=7906 RepID=A0A444U481_ACIRT|nr:Cleavage and polyadenylation specificity factor subunit 6 [Acipenser ruthenus]
MHRNRAISSSAISKAVSWASGGDLAGAIETLLTAIAVIKQSRVSSDERCRVLLSALKDCLHSIEAKSYGSRKRPRSHSRTHSWDSARRHRERSHILGLASEAAVQLSGTEEEGHAGIQADNATADKDSPVAVLQLQHGAPVQQGELQELQHQGASVEGLQQHQGPPVQQGALQELMQEQPVEVLQSQEQLVQQGEPVQERGRAGEQDAMFETLCSELLSAISLLNTSMSEILDLKEELLSHTLPGSLLIRLAVATGRLFRRSQGLLSVAVRRLQLLDANSRRTHQQQRVQDWERLFAKLMSSKTVGGRWRFRLDSLKQRDLEGRLLDSRPPHSAPVWPERGGAETQEAADGLTDREDVPSVRGSVLGSPQCHSVSVPLFSGQAPQLSASLTLSLRWLEEELPRWAHRTTQAWSLAEVLLQATGVDLSELSPEELLQRLQRPALSEACTSPIAWPRQEPQLWDSSTAPVASLLTGPELQDACCSALSPQLGLEQALAHCVRELDQVKEEHSRAIAELKERHRFGPG